MTVEGYSIQESGLKPCPFCGEREHLYPGWKFGDAPGTPARDLHCLGCGSEFIPHDGKDARTEWNRRPPERVTVTALPYRLRYYALKPVWFVRRLIVGRAA